MFSLFKRIWNYRWILRSIPLSLYFNFHYLPFNQAIHLPILLYKPKLLSCKGQIRIICKEEFKFGMIKLGCPNVSLYPNSGIIYENHGGTIIFEGRCFIGNASAISVGKTGHVKFGENFTASAALKLTSYNNIIFEKNILCGWDCLFMDTDFHQLSSTDNKILPKPYGQIHIKNNCWFALRCTIMKNTYIPEYTVIAGQTLVNSHMDIPSHSLIAGIPGKLVRTGIYRDANNDMIDYNR